MSLIQIGQPFYEWKTRQGLILVTQSGQLINQDPIKKIVTSVNIYNKLSYTFEFNQLQCKHLDISPCENYLAYWLETDKSIFVAITDAPGGGDRTINLSLRIPSNSQIFQLFWTRNHICDEPLLLIVTNSSLELFALCDDMTMRTIKRLSISCLYCWGNNIAGCVLLLTSNTGSSAVLRPYRLVNKTIEVLDALEIEMPNTDPIQQDDIELLFIYGKVYCVHKYVKGGIISLRPLGIRSLEPDIVLSVSGNGKVEICLIDNLLLLIDSHLTATVYDVGFSDESLQKIFTTHIQVPWLKLHENEAIDDMSDCNTNCSQEFEFELEGISFHLPAIFISLDEGTARPVEINWSRVEKHMDSEFTPISCINFYQRRLSRKAEMINLLYKLVDNGYETTELCNVFNIISRAYRSTVQSARESLSKDTECKFVDGIRLWAVPADMLKKFIGESSILTETDILNELFYKILNITNNDSATHIVLKDKCKAQKVLMPLLCYLKSLASVSVAPSPCLNGLLFDLCLCTGKFNTLRSFLVNGVILPSKIVLNRITKFETEYPDQRWIKQIHMDMDITMKNWNSVVQSLLHNKEYLLALDILWKNKVVEYPLYKILSAAATDVKSQECNPRLWCNLLNKVIKWANIESTPNLEKCSMWLPMLKDKISEANDVSLDL